MESAAFYQGRADYEMALVEKSEGYQGKEMVSHCLAKAQVWATLAVAAALQEANNNVVLTTK